MTQLRRKRTELIFDIGETLLNFHKQGHWYDSLRNETLPIMYRSIKSNKLYQKIPDTEKFIEYLYKSISNRPSEKKDDSFAQRIMDGFNDLSIPCTPPIIQEMIDIFYHSIESAVSIYPDVKQTIQQLSSEKYKLGIFSNTPWQSPGKLMDQLLKKFNLIQYFPVRFYSGDLKLRKPNPKIFDPFLDLGLSRDCMIYIGDSSVDIQVSKNFGIPCIWVNRLNNLLPIDAPKPDLVVQLLTEIPELIQNLN